LYRAKIVQFSEFSGGIDIKIVPVWTPRSQARIALIQHG
jgi:hypothetical protein